MATSKHSAQEEKHKLSEDSPDDLSLLPEIQNGSFLQDNNLICGKEITSPSCGNEAPSLFFQTLTDTVEDEYSEFFYILNPLNGKLEEAGPSNFNLTNGDPKFGEDTDIIPAKKLNRGLSLYEETLLKEFSIEIEKEQKLLADEHEMKMKLWDLEMQVKQQQHALKMTILKEKLEKVQQERKNLQRERNAKYLSKFRSGPI